MIPHRFNSTSTCSLAGRAVPRALAFAGLLLAGAGWPAGAAELGPLTQISGDTSFAGCPDNVDGQEGANYPGSEIEPWIDANPSDASNLIAGWQQDRWSNGGSRGLVSAHTDDGGVNWNEVPVPGVTLCTGGTYVRASDPWIGIAPSGVAYFFSLAFDPDLPNGAFGANAMLVSRSTDGGQSWGAPTTLIADNPGQTLNDKNSLTADYTNANFAYAVWDRLRDFTLPTGPSAHASPVAAVHAHAGAGDGVAAARERMKQLKAKVATGASPQGFPTFFEGPAHFSRTVNGGNTWETPKKIFDPGPNAQTIANQVAVLPNGAIIDFFTHIYFTGQVRIGFVKSLDKGATFGGESIAQMINTNGVVTPDSRLPVRDASILFDVAVDKSNGNLYLVWQDARSGGVDQVAFSMSTDGGLTWSPPINVNKTPLSSNRYRRQAFVPSIEVAANGRLAVTYYDFRNDVPGSAELTDHWAVFCDPATSNCRKGTGWGSEQRLTQTAFDIAKAPDAGGVFLGDYMGLVASGNVIYPAFGMVDGAQKTSIFTRSIDLTGTLAAASR